MAKGTTDLNDARREGPPPTRIASPITTGFSPAQRGTLDDVRNLSEPSDPTGSLPKRKK